MEARAYRGTPIRLKNNSKDSIKGLVAQLIEQFPCTEKVASLSLARSTKFTKAIRKAELGVSLCILSVCTPLPCGDNNNRKIDERIFYV